MTLPPTNRHAEALDAIRRLTTAAGVPPSYAQLRAELGLRGQGAVQNLITRMADRGLITFAPNRARSIRIVEDGDGLEVRSTADLVSMRDRINSILRGRAI